MRMDLQTKMNSVFTLNFKWNLHEILWTFYKVSLLVSMLTPTTCTGISQHAWELPGCHRVGHIRTVQMPGCIEFNITANACRGFCTSFSVPSPYRTLLMNSNHFITSRAECCNIAETYDLQVTVRCMDGLRQVAFKSALTCGCSVCRQI